MNLLGGGIELAPLITKIKVDIAGFKKDMEGVKSEAVQKANEVSKEMESTLKVGQSMSKVGTQATKFLTLPLLGVGVAAGKMAIDFESSFAKVSTLLDENIIDYDQYKNDILDASSASKVAVGEFSEAVYQSISAGVDQTKAIGFTTEAMKLAKGGFTDGAKAVDVITTALNAYGLETADAAKVSDMLITTQNLGKTTVDELASSIGRVIPTANAFNVDLGNVSTTMAILTKNGIATAEATTYYNSMLNDLGTAGTKADIALREMAGKGFAELTAEGVPLTEILAMLKENAEASGKSLGDMFNAEASKAAMTIMKDGGVEYNDILNQMENSAGATQQAFEKMDATPAEKFKGSINNLKNAGIKLGEAMIPMITKVADMIGVFAEKISKSTPEQAEMIVKIGATVAAVGPLLKVGGSLISGFAKLKPLVSGISTGISKGLPLLGKLGSSLSSNAGIIGKVGGVLSKLAPAATTATTALTSVGSGAGAATSAVAGVSVASGGLLSSLGGMAMAALPWVAGAAAIGTAAYGIYKVLDQDVIPEVDLFKDSITVAYDEMGNVISTSTVKISEETQKQVQSYIDLSNTAQQESMNMYVGITKVTDENVTSITSKVNDMSTQITSATNTQRDEVTKGYQDMFNNTTVLTAEEQTEIMNSVNNGYDQRITKTTELKDELIQIYEEIKENGGNITQSQQERIDQIYADMKEQAVQAMAENEAEQNVILNRLSSNTESVTAEMVGDSIKQLNDLRDKSIQSAAEKRDALVLEAEKLKTLEGGKYAEKAEAIIKAANDEYEGAKTASEKLRIEGIDKLMLAHGDMADDIDVETGEVVSYWDKMFGTWDRWTPDKKVAEIETKYTSSGRADANADNPLREGYNPSYRYNGLDYVPFDGYNARLHEGERILTKKENESYTSNKYGGAGNGDLNLNLYSPTPLNPSESAQRMKEMLQELALGV